MAFWQSYSEKFDNLSVREKWLALLAGIILTLLIGVTYGIEPLLKTNSTTSTDNIIKQSQLGSLEQQQQLYMEALAVDPNAEYQQQLAQLTQRMQAVDESFADEIDELVSPAMMPALMQEVLFLSGSLTLESMQSIKPVDIFADKPDMQGVSLYQHAIRLTFLGDFVQISAFLESLENTSWQVYWRTMRYDVVEHPNGQLTLEFYTLSTQKELIRV